MRSSILRLALLVSTPALLLTGCSSGGAAAPTIDFNDSRRFLGRDSDVRIDAQMSSERIGSNSRVHLALQVQNLRSTPIALDPTVSETSYDPETETITVILGAEIPEPTRQMSLSTINSGEKKAFAANAHVRVLAPSVGPFATRPRYIRVKVNYLGDVAPFAALINETKPASRVVSDELFPKWIESNQTVLTNALPIDWTGMQPALADVSQRSASGVARRSF